jgi:hypothetical protein
VKTFRLSPSVGFQLMVDPRKADPSMVDPLMVERSMLDVRTLGA